MTLGRARERLLHPQTTIRWRLTLLYGGMFLVCGAALLAVTYGLVSHAVTGGGVVALRPRADGGFARRRQVICRRRRDPKSTFRR